MPNKQKWYLEDNHPHAEVLFLIKLMESTWKQRVKITIVLETTSTNGFFLDIPTDSIILL